MSTASSTPAAVPTLPQPPRDFGVTDDHGLLKTAARKFLAQRFARPRLRALHDRATIEDADTVASFDPALHQEIAALGWLDTTSFGYLGAALLCDEAGRALCPAPIATSAIAHDLLLRAGHACADDVATGVAQVHVDVEGSQSEVTSVPRGTTHLLLHTSGTDWRLVSAKAKGVSVSPEKTVDPTRGGLRVHIADREDGDTITSLTRDQALARALTLLAAESCGAAETALVMTRDYACERQQFGRPIGTFQAVSHPIVNTMIAVEHARSLVFAAAAAIDAGRDAQVLARMAKSASADALRDATTRGIQLHGGFGFTWDCDMHFYFRRSLHDHAQLGTPAQHRAFLSEMLLRR